MKLSSAGLLVLKVCLERSSGLYGYELMQTTGLASGTLYPLLMRFEDKGWLSSRWESAEPTKTGRPRRRLYRITASGAAVAREELGRFGSVMPA